VPDRDIILALTADEEGGKSNGVDWLIRNHRELIDAEFVLNHDGGGILTDHGRPVLMAVDATEKLYADYQLSVTNPGGHSSLPVPDNAIYHLANGLVRLEHYEFPVELNNVTRAYYERLSQDAMDHSKMRTTCVATRLEAGHANNALPQMARANVNCRIAPGKSSEDIRHKLIEVLNDPKINVKYVGAIGEVTDRGSERQSYAPPPLRPDVFQPLEKVVKDMWPGTPVIPTMSTGASDGVYTNAAGLPTYGISGTSEERGDHRSHGKDERMGMEAFYKGVEFYYRYLKAVTTE
jgi:acetylornithine deacetylase/succinyl-diaminopimelate desuccinylase-like protein